MIVYWTFNVRVRILNVAYIALLYTLEDQHFYNFYNEHTVLMCQGNTFTNKETQFYIYG